MAYKSPTEINWSEGAGASIDYVNEITNAVFSNMLLFSLYFIVLWGVYKANRDIISAFAVAGFTNVLIGLLMWIGGWVTWVTFAICVGLAVIGAAAVIIDKA